MRELTYVQAVTEALGEELARDGRVFLIGEDIGRTGGVFGATRGLLDKFGPARVRQTPISENGIIGVAAGASMLGLRPVAEIMYFSFITLAMDQIFNQLVKMRYMSNGTLWTPMVIRTQGGGGRGKGPQHSDSVEAWFYHMPGLKIAMPYTPYDAKGLLKTAIRDDNPVLFIENAMLYNDKGDVPQEDYTIPFGQAVVRRAGKDVTIVTYSRMVRDALKAAGDLESLGISAEVIDLRTLIPLDWDTVIGSVKKTGRVLVLHEAYKKGGIGGDIASEIMARAFDYLDAPVLRLGAKESPIPFARSLEEAILPNQADIVAACQSLIS
jgi:pyruvate/2-oxoglutarate/acetoin dehydrogenase E1 component